jgi:O-antigen ligase
LIACGFLGAGLVYLAYHPSDAAAVEGGDGLWFAMIALATCLFANAEEIRAVRGATGRRWGGDALDGTVCLLAAWMFIAAFGNSSVANLRMATNEAWIWVAGAAIFIALRRLAIDRSLRSSLLLWMVVCATGLAVFGLHQELITLPANRLAFERDPERVLQASGIEAPPGSAERAIFAGRLYDGGPSATFALANSLAMPLVAGMLCAGGVIRFTWQRCKYGELVVWLLVAVVCGAALLATRSRAGMVVTAIGLGWLCVAPRAIDRQRKLTVQIFALLGVIGGAAVGLIVADRFDWLPSSLAFRMQYWRATLRMVIDRPLFGAGPGNFQSLYERFREADTSEQIVDPHNLLFETLGSGGWVAFALLVLATGLGLRKAINVTADGRPENTAAASDHGRALWIGACISLALIWLFGFASRQLPDVDANLFALPLAVAVGAMLAKSVSRVDDRELERIFGILFWMGALHLMVSGGWTVPGVAMVIWIAAGVRTRAPRAGTDLQMASETDQPANPTVLVRVAFAAVGICIALMIALYLFSIRPVEVAARKMAIADNAVIAGHYSLAERALQAAAVADPWSAEAKLLLADLYRWQIIAEDTVASRRLWERAIAAAQQRGGENPAIWRAIGTQQLHVFQRSGRSEDLAAAANTFEQVVRWSPVNQWMVAQLASIAAATGDQSQAVELANRARQLSSLGVNAERRFELQMIYPAEPFGDLAKSGPIRRSAATVLVEVRTETSGQWRSAR